MSDGATQQRTLDGLFRRAAVGNPDAVAFVDPANRAWFTDGEPLHLTYSQADRIVWAIGARLHALGLRAGDVVAVQLPNTAESILTLLGILRARMTAALLPMLWRESEIVAALSGTAAKAIMTTARIGETDHCDIAMKVAARLFSIRHVCAFGQNLPDGITPLDETITGRGFDVLALGTRGDMADELPAVITFEPSARGIAAVTRNNAQIIAGGLHLASLCSAKRGTAVLSATPISSFAGLCATLMGALLSGGGLILQQPFDATVFAETLTRAPCGTVILPGNILQDFIDRGLLGGQVDTIVALWRAPERAETPAVVRDKATIVDLRAFGEIGLLATSRAAGGALAPIPVGRIGDEIELKRSETGTLALRGAMVAWSIGQTGGEFADTGYPCRAESGHLVMSGGRPDMIGIGGYGIARADLDALATVLELNELITPLPDALLGQRLAASQPNRDVEALLADRGANPLVSSAFRRRQAA